MKGPNPCLVGKYLFALTLAKIKDLIGWWFGFYGISTFVGYLTTNSVYMNIRSNLDF